MTHPIDTHVGNQIRSRRRELKITQVVLAKSLGLTFQQVQKYETGANRVSASKLAEISDLLGTSIIYFFPDEYQDQALSKEERALIAAYRSADIESRKLLSNVVAKIAKSVHAAHRLERGLDVNLHN